VEGYSRSEAIRWFISEGLFAAEKARAKEPTKSWRVPWSQRTQTATTVLRFPQPR